MMPSWRFKACPRCGGDSFIDKDMDGWYEQCLLCSHRRELKDLDQFRRRPVQTGTAQDERNAA